MLRITFIRYALKRQIGKTNNLKYVGKKDATGLGLWAGVFLQGRMEMVNKIGKSVPWCKRRTNDHFKQAVVH